jgi:hypothetical protein
MQEGFKMNNIDTLNLDKIKIKENCKAYKIIQVLSLIEGKDEVTYKVTYNEDSMAAFLSNVIDKYGIKEEKYLENVMSRDALNGCGDEVVDQIIDDLGSSNNSLIGSPKSYNIFGIVLTYPKIYHTLNNIMQAREIDFSGELIRFLRYGINNNIMHHLECLNEFINLLELEEIDRTPFANMELKTKEWSQYYIDNINIEKSLNIAKENTIIFNSIKHENDINSKVLIKKRPIK